MSSHAFESHWSSDKPAIKILNTCYGTLIIASLDNYLALCLRLCFRNFALSVRSSFSISLDTLMLPISVTLVASTEVRTSKSQLFVVSTGEIGKPSVSAVRSSKMIESRAGAISSVSLIISSITSRDEALDPGRTNIAPDG